MIRYALSCDRDHAFESWFQSSEAFEKQAKRGLVLCPACGSKKVEKSLMAPSLKRRDKSTSVSMQPEKETPSSDAVASPPDKTPVALVSEQEREFRTKLKELRDHLTRNSDNVGSRFPEEARRMHHGEIEHRSIYGEASPDEARELHEEGIEFHPLPSLPDERN